MSSIASNWPSLHCSDAKADIETFHVRGSGCGSVGRAVAFDTRDPQFESRHRQNFIYQLYNRKDENKEKEAGNGPSLKKNISRSSSRSIPSGNLANHGMIWFNDSGTAKCQKLVP